MKFPPHSFFLFFMIIFLMFSNEIYARKGPEEYWKEIMKDQPLPEALNGIIEPKRLNPSEKTSFWSHFKRDFDVTSNVIIYHPHQQNNHLSPSI
ncbi:organ-specific protein P4-like isoform X2 [Amaranthus tricolor]|uniref:organ-specific protein P4-like isoform X2 n=1 Tax=Amaranthus tricolor TaxID=29722 RepID=UPI002590D245|nr:organ-specific protein P4-like isoform X2 [Amaranthus tricolor]